MHKTLTIVFFLILASTVHKANANISLGACSLSCNENEHQAHDLLGDGAQGAPGKRGPLGPKGGRGFKGDPGSRGEPGQSCECPDREELKAKVSALQTQIDDLKGQVHYASTGWTKASNDLYYKFFAEKANYVTAKSKCANFGARLAAAGLRTAVLRREIKDFFPKLLVTDTWIGLDDLVNQGSYVWSDGVKSTTGNTDWYPGQPHNHAERCACMIRDKVHDTGCSSLFNYLCEVTP